MATIERVIGMFGGGAALARKLGMKHASRVIHWKERGLIPAHWQRPILDLARLEGLPLAADDVIFSPPGYEPPAGLEPTSGDAGAPDAGDAAPPAHNGNTIDDETDKAEPGGRPRRALGATG